MRSKLLLASVVLSIVFALHGSGRQFDCGKERFEERLQKQQAMETASYRHVDQIKQVGQDECSKANNFQVSFFRELQSNRTLCIDAKKIQNSVEVIQVMAAKEVY